MKNNVEEGEKHFTASVWIITKTKPRKMLLHYHKKLKRWLQFGGHIEKFENPVEAAARETKEETGLDISFILDDVKIINEEGSFLPVPRFLMEQTIPAHADQHAHFHEDFQYVVEVDEFEPTSEHADGKIGWFTKEEILELPIHEDTRVVVEELM